MINRTDYYISIRIFVGIQTSAVIPIAVLKYEYTIVELLLPCIQILLLETYFLNDSVQRDLNFTNTRVQYTFLNIYYNK